MPDVWSFFIKYCIEKLDEYDFDDMFHHIKSTGEYDCSNIRELIALSMYSESVKQKIENVQKLNHYFVILSDKETRDTITLTSLLFIVAFCYKCRDRPESPNDVQSNLYI